MRPELLYPLFSSAARLKGVGPSGVEQLTKLFGLPEGTPPRVRDVVFHLPVSLIDRRFTCPLASAPEGKVGTFIVRVESHAQPPRANGRGARKPYKVFCRNETGTLTLVFFHASPDYMTKTLPVGSTRVVSGRIEHFDYHAQMTHPDIIAPIDQLASVQRLEPVYPLTLGLTPKRLAGWIAQALKEIPELPEWIDPGLLAERKWPGFCEALKQAHQPQDEADLQPDFPARARLAYDEILANQLRLAQLRQRIRQTPGIMLQSGISLRKSLLANLPFTLTKGQAQVISEIDADMASGKRMVRLLQGDVGSGKTLVALMAMLSVAEAGMQAALMAPTELIAQQHYQTISNMLSGMDMGVCLLTGSIKGKAREEALACMASGAAKIIIGTHALFQDKVEFNALALAVVDEQHRFGVAQRMALAAKGDSPHLLHMTATPIPRSLTMACFGDMDISQLKEKPAGRQPITTRLIALSRYDELQAAIARALLRREKIYWICPLIEPGGDGEMLEELARNDLAAAETRFREFNARFKGKVALVHGRMKADLRQAAMEQFARGDVQLLVATTVVEVGVDVRDATIIIIEKAERFGLSQLHQLRGRVGRGDQPSSCVLLYSDAVAEEARARLSILRESEDGFAIAEADRQLRGSGDVLGLKQSGMPQFHFFEPYAHSDFIEHAQIDAKNMLEADPKLESERGSKLALMAQVFDV